MYNVYCLKPINDNNYNSVPNMFITLYVDKVSKSFGTRTDTGQLDIFVIVLSYLYFH